jgi:protease I
MTDAPLQGKTVAFLVAQEGVEEVELSAPWKAVEDAGGTPQLLAPQAGEIQAFNHLDKSSTYPVDEPLDDADPDSYAALVLPGGVANPDQLRTDERAIEFVRAIFSAGKPVGVICHGPWTLVEADVVRGRKLTSWPSLKTDIRNAGGEWVDEQLVVDEGLVSSRKPDDLPVFCTKIVEEFAEGRHQVAPHAGAAETRPGGGSASSSRSTSSRLDPRLGRSRSARRGSRR